MRVFFLLSLFLCVAGVALPVKAAPDNMDGFAEWPVLYEGRINTMDGFARSALYKISGETETPIMSAVEWVALTLFDPGLSAAFKIIRVDGVDLLELEERSPPLYSMNEVMVGLRPYKDLLLALDAMPKGEFTASQKRLYDVYAAVSLYNQLLQSFSPILLLDGTESQTYLSLRNQYTDKLSVNETQDFDAEAMRVSLIDQGGQDNTVLRFIPAANPTSNEPLVSLWQTLNAGEGSPYAAQITALLSDMAMEWDRGDYDLWGKNAETIRELVIASPVFQQHYDPAKLYLENAYNRINPVFWIMICYLLTAGLVIAGKPQMAGWLCALGLLMQITTIAMRVYILSRPPVATLYETLLFASAFIILTVYILFLRNRNYLVLCGGAVASLILLVISQGFIQGDSFSVLVAVLNTDFWLATHVVCIVIGYGACIVAALIAHFYLLQPYLLRRHYITPSLADNTASLLLPMTVTALFFTGVGTLLGGIWADQSWGRFWGWDPKENGALLIVIWLIWILHGRLSGHFRDARFVTALALTNIPVALTWFGVNLLGVGLHSYGFISGIAYGLLAFCVLQIIIIGLLVLIYKRHKHAS